MWLEPTQAPKFFTLKQMKLCVACFQTVAQVRVKGSSSPTLRERDKASCFKPLLKGNVGFMYKREGR